MGVFNDLVGLSNKNKPASGSPGSSRTQATQPTVTMNSARQRLMFQEEEEEKWYRGSEPTRSEVTARICRIGQEDPEQGEKLWSMFTELQSDQSSPFYDPYSQATSRAVSELGKMGFDMTGGVTDDWLQQNSWLKDYYRTGVSGTPLAPSSTSTAQQNAAYWYYQLLQDEDTTKQAENEWAALQEEIGYWAGRSDRNYSDDEILGRIDWSNYKTLTRMDQDRQQGTPTSLNRAVGYSQDALYGTLWAARGNESTGNPYLDSVKYALGMGSGYTRDERISAMLNPSSDKYSPYAVGSTLDDAALYFGVSSFGPEWLEENRSILSGKDATAKKMYQKVYDAEQTTLKAEAELASVRGRVDEWLKYTSDPDTILDGLLDDCPTLKKLDESMASGSLVATTRAIDYRWADLESSVREKCANVNSAPATGVYTEQVGTQLGYQMPVTESQAAVESSGTNAMNAAAPTILEMGTAEEKQVWRSGYSADFETYLLEMNAAMNDGTADAKRNYGFCLDTANEYANAHYLDTISVLRPYERVQVELDSAKRELEDIRNQLWVQQESYARSNAPKGYTYIGTGEYGADGDEEWSMAPAQASESDAPLQDDYHVIKEIAGRDYEIHATRIPGTNQYTFSHAYALDTMERIDAQASAKGGYTGTGEYGPDGDEEWSMAPTGNDEVAKAGEAFARSISPEEQVSGMTERSDLTPEQQEAVLARKAELEATVPQLEEYLRSQEAQYSRAQDAMTTIQAGYDAADRMRALAGVEEGDSRSSLAIMDYAYQYGAEYRPTEYATASLYDLALEQGGTYAETAQAARAGLQQNQEQIQRLDWVLQEIEDRGMTVGQDYLDNLRREKERLNRDVLDAQYFLLRGNSDFTETAEKTRKSVLGSQQYFGMGNGYSDLDLYAADPSKDFIAGTGGAATYMGALTQEERDTYLYLLAVQGEDSAKAYYDHLTDSSYGVVLTRMSENAQANSQRLAQEYPVLGTVLSVISSPLQMSGAVYSAWQTATGQEINPYNPAFGASTMVGSIRATVKEDITEALGEGTPGAFLANMGYDVLTSAGDSMVSGIVGGTTVGAVSAMAAGAASSAIQDAKLRGATDEQALMMGGAAFIAESVTEYIPMDDWMKFDGSAVTFKGMLTDAMKQFASEALGEGSSEILTQASDRLIMQGLSGWETSKADYRKQGMSEQEAEAQAWRDCAYDVLYATLTGGLSGSLSISAKYAMQSAMKPKTGSTTAAETQRMTEDGTQAQSSQEAAENTEPAGEPAMREQEKITVQDGENATQEPEISTNEDGENAGQEPEISPNEDGENQGQETSFEQEYPFMEDGFGPDADAAEEAQRQSGILSRQVAALTMAEATTDEAAQAATVGAVLAPAEPTITTTSTAGVAAQHLISEYGVRGIGVVRDALLTAAETGADTESVKTALITAALHASGQARQVLDGAAGGNVTAETVPALIAAAREDIAAPGVMEQIGKRVEDSQVATRVAQLVADGALEGIRSYEDALNQAKTNLRTAKKNLETAQARQTATAQNLQSATAQFVSEPGNQMLRGAVQQATKDVEGAIQVVLEYQQSEANAQSAVKSAETTLNTVRDSTLKKVRQQAQEEVARAKTQAQAQQEQESYQQAMDILTPTVPFGKTSTATLKSGESVNITGAMYKDAGGYWYLATDTGKVYKENQFKASSLMPIFDGFVDGPDFDGMDQTLKTAQKPVVPFEESIEVMLDGTGEVTEALGLMPALAEDAAGHPNETQQKFYAQLMLKDGSLVKYIDVTPMTGSSYDLIDSLIDGHKAELFSGTAQEGQNGPSEATQAGAEIPSPEAEEAAPAQNAPQLEAWQDPQYHGKVKTARKLRTNTQNFKSWFSDPSGDLSNPDGTPRVIYRGTGSTLYMEHKAQSGGAVMNFYSPDLSIVKTYAHGSTHKIKTYDMVNWETAAAAMKAEGFDLQKEQNTHGEWGYRAYGVVHDTQGEKGSFYREHELARFNKEYGGVQRIGLYAGYMSLKNPLVIDAGGSQYTSVHATVKDKDGNDYTDTRTNRGWGKWARDNGYDACIVRNVKDNLSGNSSSSVIPGTVIMAFNPSSFKSMWNTGKLGKTNPDIRYNKSGAFALTGKPVSEQMKAIRAKLETGQEPSVEEVMGTPEVQWAEKRMLQGESLPYRQTPYTAQEMAGMVSPERASLQEDIREELMGLGSAVIDRDGKTSYTGAVQKGKRLDVVIGPPAAGKSSALADWISQAFGSRVLDSDMVKERLPEYQNGLNSGYLHQESRYIWQRMINDAAAAGDNVVLPIVGGSLSSVQRNISEFTDAGYTANVHYVALERGKTLSRALGRFLSQGRYISPDYLYKATNGNIDKTYEALKMGGELDGYSKWSNDVPQGQHPILIESDSIGNEIFQAANHGGNPDGRGSGVHGGGPGTPQANRGGIQGLAGQEINYLRSTPQARQGASSMRGKPSKSPFRLAKELAKSLNLGDAIGTRKMNNMPSAVLGYYENRAKYVAVRARQAGNYTVTMHEIFHDLSRKLNMTGTQDMVNQLDPLFTANYSAAELPGEAFAEFGWRYMADEASARSFAGDAFVDSFERELRRTGNYKAVHQAATELRAWLGANVQEQIGATIRAKSERPSEGGFRKQMSDLISRLVDDTSAAEKVDKAVRDSGGNADVRQTALMKNFSARRAYAILTENLTDANWTVTGDSLATRLEGAGITAQNEPMLMQYWLALHSLDRDAQGKPVFDAYITPSARQAFIDDVQRNHPEVVAGEQAIQDFRKEFLQAFMVDTGFLSQEDFDAMNAMYPHYAPTFRVKNQGAGKTFKNSKRYQIRTATGSTEDIINPMDSFVSMVDSVVTMVSANNAALAWDRAYRSTEGLGVYGREITPDARQVSVDVSELQSQIAQLLAGNTQDDIFQQVIDLVGTRQSQWITQNGSTLPNVITVQQPDGTRRYYEIFDTELYKLLASQRDGGISAMRTLGMLTRGMSALTTGSNPVFALRNFMRDFQNTVNYGTWATNYATGFAKWLRASYDIWTNGGEYKDYVALGGGGWTRIEAGTKKGAEDYRAALYKGYERSTPGKTAKWVGKKLWNTVTLARLNEVVEQTSRYAEYKYGKHDKSTPEGRREAFLASQDVTVDFARSGNSQLAAFLKQVIPFFGASEQGIYRTGRMLTETERSKAPQRFVKTVVNTALMSAISAAVMLKFSDDDEKEAFAMMSDDLKSQHFYLPNFAPEVFGQQPLIRIPLAQDPLTYAVHGAVTNALWSGETDGPVIGFAAIANTIVDNLNPVSSGSVLQPLIGIGQNKNWYGSRIVPSYMSDWEETTKYTEETPDIFVGAGRALGMSPLKVQYLAEQYTGFLGQMAIPALSKNPNTGELGGLRAAIAAAQKKLTSDPLISNDIVGSFYDGYNAIASVVTASKNDRPLNMLRRGLSEEEASSAYQDAYDLTHAGGTLYDTRKAIGEKYDEIDEINANDTLTDAQKYELTSAVRREMISTTLAAQEAIGEYNAKYITGRNVVTDALYAGERATIPTAMDRLDATFKADSKQLYMQQATSVWEATGRDSALPHPAGSFSSAGKTYQVAEADWENWTLQYKMGYQEYLAKNGKLWNGMDDGARLEVLQKAHTAGHNKAKEWYKKLYGIK